MSLPARLPASAPSVARRDRIETLLRERKLDRTLTTVLPGSGKPGSVAAFGLTSLDARLLGGLPRGHMSELVGPISSGRTSLALTWLGAATARDESVALIDTFDRFDPASGQLCGIDLTRLLWVRGQAITKTSGTIDPAWLPGARAVDGPGTLVERTIDRALKALNLVLQSGVCTAVVFDFADVPLAGIRRVPLTTWLRLQRVVEGTETACLLIGPVPLARSAGGVTIATAADQTGDRHSVDHPRAAKPGGKVRWAGADDRSRRLAGLEVHARVGSPRRTVHGTASVQTIAREVAIGE